MEHGTDMALQIALLMALGAACRWLAWRLRIAAILPSLIASDTEQIAARKQAAKAGDSSTADEDGVAESESIRSEV